MQYPIAIEPGDENVAYGIIVPDIVGCYSASDNAEDILTNAREAIIGHLRLIIENGESIPAATSIENHLNNPDFEGMYWEVVDIRKEYLY